MKGLESVKSTRMLSGETPNVETGAPTDLKNVEIVEKNAQNPIVNAVAENFSTILAIAGNLIELEKMRVQSDAILAQMEAERQRLIAETDAYCRRMERDNERYLGKLEKIRLIMADYNKCGKDTGLSEEAFCTIITQIINSEK